MIDLKFTTGDRVQIHSLSQSYYTSGELIYDIQYGTVIGPKLGLYYYAVRMDKDGIVHHCGEHSLSLISPLEQLARATEDISYEI